MFIRFDDLDMLEFFEEDPVPIGDYEEGNLIYSLEDKLGFKLILTLDTYSKKIDISVTYNDNIIFTGEYSEVLEIKKADNNLIVYLSDNKRILLKKDKQIGVILE